jgi:hypothetical protein
MEETQVTEAPTSGASEEEKDLSLEEMVKKHGRDEVAAELIKRGSSTWDKEERLFMATTAFSTGNVMAAAQFLRPLGFKHRGATLTRAVRTFLFREAK